MKYSIDTTELVNTITERWEIGSTYNTHSTWWTTYIVCASLRNIFPIDSDLRDDMHTLTLLALNRSLGVIDP